MLKIIALELLKLPQLKQYLEALEKKCSSQLLYGLDSSARNLLMAAIRLKTGRPVLIVTPDPLRAAKVYEDLLSVFGEEEVLFFPGRELLYYYSLLSESGDVARQRLAALQRLSLGKNIVLVTTVAGVMTKMMPPGRWLEFGIKLQPGEERALDGLLAGLVAAGYERVAMVEAPGQVSIRGGIVDLYPAGEPGPYRVEFYGDTVDSVRRFDPASQRSLEKVEQVWISPAHEMVFGSNERQRAVAELEQELEALNGQVSSGKRAIPATRLAEKLREHLEKLREEIYFPGADQYLLYFYTQPASLFDYLPPHTLLFIDDPLRCEQVAEQFARELLETQSTLLAQGELLARQADLTWQYTELLAEAPQQLTGYSLFAQNLAGRPYRHSFSLSARPVPRFLGRWDLLGDELAHWRRENYRTVILTTSRQRSSYLAGILEERKIPAFDTHGKPDLQPRSVTLMQGILESGFVLPDLQLAVLTEQDILPQRKRQRRLKGKEGLRIGDYQELQVGEYVVHEQHGIGQYLGIRTLEVSGTHRDYLYIQYAGNDKLYIPVEQIGSVRKYIGVEGRKPKLYALGGGEWSRVKARVQASIQELAQELLALYAAREAVPGHAFSPDHPWQKDFEAAFPYEETVDQLQATLEVKADMEKGSPMDRLLCGDVGFGKTEVALRAAFKAIMDGKQVAFLVPTTVLAQQHYRNFVDRFAGFPVAVDVLSRFQSTAEQKATLKNLREGRIDLIIGTHRLLSRDVRFRDLGLLIIDEEQRFGVRHKEKIKMLKQNVDVLTMTATPIPRTLHMALAGVRDMSVIETPPEDRYPIQTYVLEYADTLIREAVLRELGRGGQVYFVHNRVQTIEQWAAHLRELLPEARLAVAHGQMPEEQLEAVMIAFLKGEYDLLLSTTIVEAGLDIPNVNTIIINDADKFGLSQLYQLRGRVGRSNRIAYCYLTYRRDKVLTETAEKRLQAIKEFTELGSGFKIALRDLEIRGAGNILGPEQHGFMVAVGFDLYLKLLEEAISTYKGEGEKARVAPRIELNVDAFLPSAYISDTRQKIVFYQKVASLQSIEDIKETREELCDRFGPLPPSADNLLNVAHLRLLADELGVTSVTEEKDEIYIRFAPDCLPHAELLLAISRRYRGRLTVSPGKQYVLAFRVEGRSGVTKLLFLLELFDGLKRLAKEKKPDV